MFTLWNWLNISQIATSPWHKTSHKSAELKYNNNHPFGVPQKDLYIFRDICWEEPLPGSTIQAKEKLWCIKSQKRNQKNPLLGNKLRDSRRLLMWIINSSVQSPLLTCKMRLPCMAHMGRDKSFGKNDAVGKRAISRKERGFMKDGRGPKFMRGTETAPGVSKTSTSYW